MAPRRHPLLLLSALAMVLSSFAIAPRPVQAATHTIRVDTVLDLTVEDEAELLRENYCPVPAPDAPAADPEQRTCSLRRAIVRALSLPNADVKLIAFNFFTDNNLPRTPFELTAATILPAIDKDNVQIVAETRRSFGRPVIEIDGRGKPVGLQFEAKRAYISGVSMYGFRDNSIQPFNGSAIYITGEENTVETSFIGVRSDGSVLPDDQKNYSGIHLGPGARNNIIGGPGPSAISNYISGNVQNGVIITNSSNNTIQNNVIGLIRAADDVIEAPGNGAYGIQITSSGTNNVSSGNTIGGISDRQTIRYNIIAQSGRAGIYLRGAGTTSNVIEANYIGLDLESNDRGNLGDGVRIEAGASQNSFSGASSLNPLVISASRGYGVNIRAFGSTAPVGNRFAGYIYIGTNTTGAVPANPNPLRNYLGGVRITEQARDTIFESAPGAMRIVGNGGAGITIQGSTVSGTRITGARIGGVGALANSGPGVSISQASTTELRGSTIVGNSGPGVSVSQASGTIIATSMISGNTAGGLLLDRARTSEVSQSLISNNSEYGLRLTAALTTTISANTIGLDTPRRNPLANNGPGIELRDAINTRIVGNEIAANTGLGLFVSGGSAVEVGENRFGLRRDAAQSDQPILAAPNGGVAQIHVTNGVRQVEIRSNELAGGATAADGPAGLLIDGATTDDINVRSNQIGLQFTVGPQTRTFAHGIGIAVNGARQVTIGGGNLSDGNLIRHNFGAAIRLTDSFNTNIRNNNAEQAIFKNGGGGIVIDASGGMAAFDAQSITVQENVLAENTGNAIAINGNPTLPWLADVQILTNTLRANTGYGIFVSGNVDRASFRGNLLRSNGGPIWLEETTRYNPNTGTNPGDPDRPNHDIDPPWVNVGAVNDPLRLRVKDTGIIEGYVITSTNRLLEGAPPASACVTCTLQIFQPFNTEAANRGQGGLLVRSSGFDNEFVDSFSADPITGFFARQLEHNVANMSELLLIATDGFVHGNSSEYATFPISRGLVFEQSPLSGTVGTPLVLSQDAVPGAVLTYTMQLRNPGSVTLTSLNLSASGRPSSTWGIVTDPPLGPLAAELQDGQTLPVTVTLTLPTGSDPTVRAGLIQAITLTASSAQDATVRATARLEVRMRASPVLELLPLKSTRSARPGNTADHLHVIRNDGNITVTVNFAAVTTDNLNVAPSQFWITTLNKASAILGPGEEDSLRVRVLVPPGTQEFTEAVTRVTASVPADPTAGYGVITRTAIDTTRASLAAAADLSGGSDQEAAAGAVVPFAHTVSNRSNGVATFCLGYTTNKGSTARFVSAADGFVIRPDGCFTLDTVNDEGAGRFRDAEFRVIVNVSPLLLPGELETINIELREGRPDGSLIGDATATNTVRVTRALVQPRIWLPLVQR